ncbi:MAG: D-alanyl-D-alanine carboxypeptidase family protein, partial [Alphaproteobacteria bacterium]
MSWNSVSSSRAGIASMIAATYWLLAFTTTASAFETKAEQAILIEHETGTVLLEKNADELMFPASMSKIMTAYMAFEQLAAGTLSMEDVLPISERAWRMGGSKMFVEVGKEVSVADLLRGIIVQSGNDASIVIAESLAGSEEAFAEQMTERGRELGLQDTVFRNATGWPDPDHVTTARDLAILAGRIIDDFPDYYTMFKEKTFTFNNIRQGNRNPLLYKSVGADGLKTGHTNASGYGLTASATRNDRRLILVLNGLDSVNERSQEAERLLRWGFREFENYPLFTAGETVENADVWLGDHGNLPLVLDEDLTITLPRKARQKMRVAVVYDGPISAPVAKGTEIGKLVVTAPDIEPIERPLLAGADVAQLGLFGRMVSAVSYLVFGAPT